MVRGTLVEVVVVTRAIKMGVAGKVAVVGVGGGVGEGAVVDEVPVVVVVVVRLGGRILVTLPKNTIPNPTCTFQINTRKKGARGSTRESKHQCARENDQRVHQATTRVVLYAIHTVVHGPHYNTHCTVETRKRCHWMLPLVKRMHTR
jgi:hypothetical protein